MTFIGPFNFTLNGHGYFYSGWVEEHKSDKVDWLEARNTCREYCMDLVSLETPTEDEMIKEFLTKGRNIIHKLPSIRVFSVSIPDYICNC